MNGPQSREIDTGTGYGLKPPAYRPELVEVGPGTPMGELMRRYWQPFFTTAALDSDRPRRVRLLGEDLILFRDKNGRPGLVHEHCCHRGTSLYYGRVDEDGIRCCYHGWKFDVEGRCLDQPAEIDGGRFRDKIRQPWYPVQERYGLLYAYMGPPEKKPVLPRYRQFEDLGPDEVIEVRFQMTGARPCEPGGYEMEPVPYNWLGLYENSVDAAHLPWLHYHHSGDQFTGFTPVEGDLELPAYAVVKDMVKAMIMERTELGVMQGFPLAGPGGAMMVTANEAVLPNIFFIPAFVDMAYIVPVDDTHTVAFVMWRSKYHGEKSAAEELHAGKTWWEMTEEEHQKYPGDYEAISSIGPVPRHSQEHLAQSDLAVSLLRRRLQDAVRDVAEGRDPPNLNFDEDAPPIEISAYKATAYTSAAE